MKQSTIRNHHLARNKARRRTHHSAVHQHYVDRQMKRMIKVLCKAMNSFGVAFVDLGENASKAAEASTRLRETMMESRTVDRYVEQLKIKTKQEQNHPFQKFIGKPKFK